MIYDLFFSNTSSFSSNSSSRIRNMNLWFANIICYTHIYNSCMLFFNTKYLLKNTFLKSIITYGLTTRKHPLRFTYILTFSYVQMYISLYCLWQSCLKICYLATSFECNIIYTNLYLLIHSFLRYQIRISSRNIRFLYICIFCFKYKLTDKEKVSNVLFFCVKFQPKF